MVDMVAAELKMDPAEIRFKNFVHNDEFPFPTATGLIYDTGDYSAPLRKAMDMAGYDKRRQQQTDAPAKGQPMGIRLCTYGENCAVAPSPSTPPRRWERADGPRATVRQATA